STRVDLRHARAPKPCSNVLDYRVEDLLGSNAAPIRATALTHPARSDTRSDIGRLPSDTIMPALHADLRCVLRVARDPHRSLPITPCGDHTTLLILHEHIMAFATHKRDTLIGCRDATAFHTHR